MCFSLAWVEQLCIAIIILIAFAIRWLITSFLGWPIDGQVYKWAQIVVGLICLIVLWAVVAIICVYIVFGLIACLLGGAGSLVPR